MRQMRRRVGAAEAQTKYEGGQVTTTGPYVLVVDDNAAVCRLHAEALRQASIEVEEAEDGVAALALIRERPPAVIVTDGDMPRLNGLALTRWVRGRASTRSIPIVIVSADIDSEAFAAEAWESGCDVMLGKPCSIATLQLVVRDVRRRRS
jgi:DNA-binding response OmpR family regulator